ncbi:hypothetical protein ACUIG5_18300 [Raoultella ornithinolytica]|uniref:hypothetical protein n=1 Tax=Raoultella ornithinolytica TaxID=54291 RepID=UPI00403D9BFD
MPNLTFYLSQEHAARFSDLRDLTRTCSALCTGLLAAESENVHIIYVDVKPGCGHPVYAELFYRLTNVRTSEVMEEFMRELERAIRQASGLTVRIRCFGSAASHLFARN